MHVQSNSFGAANPLEKKASRDGRARGTRWLYVEAGRVARGRPLARSACATSLKRLPGARGQHRFCGPHLDANQFFEGEKC